MSEWSDLALCIRNREILSCDAYKVLKEGENVMTSGI